jgi:hypothetical protein
MKEETRYIKKEIRRDEREKDRRIKKGWKERKKEGTTTLCPKTDVSHLLD